VRRLVAALEIVPLAGAGSLLPGIPQSDSRASLPGGTRKNGGKPHCAAADRFVKAATSRRTPNGRRISRLQTSRRKGAFGAMPDPSKFVAGKKTL
jgi:hypothetical protein